MTMASKTPVRAMQMLGRRSQGCTACANSAASQIMRKYARPLSTAVSKPEQTDLSERPRWSYTPPQMKAPFNPRIKNPEKAWECNDSPEKLDAMYIKFFGRGGEKVLTDEIKWLAVTHKSFDQGRRGFNDRLAFFGKRILLLQTNLALLNSPTATATQSGTPDEYGRTPFEHPALAGLPNLTDIDTDEILTKERLGKLAEEYGITEVMRWKPRNPQNMDGSGINVVASHALYAILGAVALSKGGLHADKIAREKILKPLGIS